MSREQSERVSRNEEIRALFIFGLLAVFASIRVQYQTLTVTYPNGSFNLAPIIDVIIILWSLYAFFMVLGLSGDTIGKSTAIVLKGISKVFLQYSYILLVFFLIPFGLIIYGVRFLLVLFIILAAFIVAIYVRIKSRPKQNSKKLSLRAYFTTERLRKNLPFVLGLIFLFSATIVFYYPDSWFGSSVIVFVAFIIAVIAVSLLIGFRKPNDSERELEDDYYF